MLTKISVVIPTFKRPKLLTRCLRALLKQTMDKGDFEVIVVSDGPDKETLFTLLPWLKKKELNLQLLQTAVKKGPAAARNYGWLSARSNFIAFTDDDCIPDRNWLMALYQKYAKEEAAYLAFSGKTEVPLPDRPTDYERNIANLATAEFITANCACSKNALLKAGGFDERFETAWREDSDLYFKFMVHQIKVLKVSDAVVTHPVRPARWGISIFEQKKSKYDALLYQKFPEYYRKKIKTDPLWSYYVINLLWMAIFITAHYHYTNLTLLFSTALVLLISAFIRKRLKNTRKSLNHIAEMIISSIVIPSLSVFWRLYGAIKYRVIFI